jgi:putative chitinase
MMVNEEQLRAIYKEGSLDKIKTFLPHLNKTLLVFGITTPLQIQTFLAQIGHESGQLRYVQELASGTAYEGRRDLGNTSPGDGVLYKGRGLIQITGKSNYTLCGLALDLPLLEKPELLEQPENAALSAGWFWYNKNLNSFCDDFRKVTRKINGGLNGLADRQKLFERAKKVIT